MTDARGLIAGRFLLGDLLGSGGFASVFAAVDERSGDAVALKLLHPHLAVDEKATAAFFAEADAAERAAHPGVVLVVDRGSHDAAGQPQAWIALESVAGHTLADVVAARGPLTATDVVDVGRELVAALAAVHHAGLVHRDVTPSNVMLDVDRRGRLRPGTVRLIDFGLCAPAGNPADDTLLGNPAYVSPEHALGLPVDRRSDLYQAGATLYFAVVGRAPFERPSAEAMLRAHVQAPAPVPSVLRPGLPTSLDRLIITALAKAPENRFDGAEEMLTALAVVELSATQSDAETPAGGTTRFTVPGVTTVSLEVKTELLAPARRAPVASSAKVRRRPRIDNAPLWAGVAVVLAVLGLGWAAASGAPGPAPTRSAATATPTPTTTPTPTPTISVIAVDRTRSTVPTLTGLSLGDAQSALAAVGLATGIVTRTDVAAVADTVLSASQPAGSRIDRGTAVDVSVASGSNAVPRVVGLSATAAVDAVRAAGFIPSLIRRVDADHADGTVLSSEPAEAEKAPVGSEVAVLVARAAPIASPTATPSMTPTTGPTQ
ncbi:protein kinase domain-containing protein [Lacisediminihabitans changchengi]|uniref:non-specific serine/threonine protein kinase n=1 Tax=Lacisediminihabitans changchengi TaxID=2787634 RepID=A0A934W5K6_9MICO|nr:PASTA domain-containing protein [Lacisediminihabitans changchengi]MBK4348615.1 PASTA domain-containing protein [Lacisediminihabitans changchengi]